MDKLQGSQFSHFDLNSEDCLCDYEMNVAEMRSLPNVVYEFDVRKYESETETLDAIKEMYDILGIKGYDREKLSIYYNDWYNKIEEIKIEEIAN